jgi:hypothetical protein
LWRKLESAAVFQALLGAGVERDHFYDFTPSPNYYVYELYAKHFGETLIPAEVECGGCDTEGGWDVLPARGRPTSFRLSDENVLPSQPWRIVTTPEVRRREEEGTLVVDLETEGDLNYFHASKGMPAQGNRVRLCRADSGPERTK